MKIVIDLGNTSTKIGCFEGVKMKKHFLVNGLIQKKEFLHLMKNNSVEAAIISSVRDDSKLLEQYIEKKFRTLNLSANSSYKGQLKLPFKNLYKTPQTLGRDRIANAAAAINLFPKKNILVVDAGTCLKFDLVDSMGRYHGGAIAPGLSMRYLALHEYTGKLPLLKPKKSSKMIGQTTEESIHSGVQLGMINEVVTTIAQYEKLFPRINIILTGGDWRLFVKHLKKSIFADPFLTLKGLHYILDYNT